jgi:type IV secretion/conjugal transfer VirB4 family ATPase
MKKDKKTETSGFFPFEEDFVPYATHINERTVVTKNLQLMQTIKVNNFLNKELHHDKKNITLREFIRNAIKKNIKSENFAFWIHAIRRKVDLHEVLKCEEAFCIDLNQRWNDFNGFERQFINELYVTIILKGPEIKDKDVALKYFTNAKLKKFAISEIGMLQEELTSVVDAILSDLQTYSATCLKIKEKNGVFYSENIEFLNKILNLTDLWLELDEADISSVLSISKMELFTNKINIKNNFTSKSIGILSLKHYLETNAEILDSVLTLPFEFVIYQAFDFVNFTDVMDKYYTQYKMLKISKDEKMMKQLGLEEDSFNNIEKRLNDVTLDYGESQIAIIVIADDENSLDKEMEQVVSVLHKTGFVFIREDVMIEDSFFACLPANFSFLRRMQPMQTAKVAGFTSIDNHPIGKINNNLWGDAVCLLKSSDGYPFFFNFHDDSKCGHTLFFGKNDDIQRNALSNFLIANSRKFDVRIISLDKDENTKIFNAFFGGKYKVFSLDSKKNTLELNPTKFLDKEGVFKKFTQNCVELNTKNTVNLNAYIEEKLIPFILHNKSKFSTFHELLNLINNQKITNQFYTQTSEKGVFYNIFGGKEDDMLSLKNNSFLSVNLEELFAQNNASLKFFLQYFLMTILIITQDKKKTILKIDNFLAICKNCKIPKSEVISILKALKENNVVLLSTENYRSFEDYEKSNEDEEIIDLFSTQIYAPAFVNYGDSKLDISNTYLKQISEFTKLTPHEIDVVSKFAFNDEVVTVKHSGKIVALQFDYAFSKIYYFVFSGRGIQDEYLINLKSMTDLNTKLTEVERLYDQFLKDI